MVDTLDILRIDGDYLEHHGILGMKWGIRRTPEQLGHRISKKTERFEKYADKATKAAEAGNEKSFNKYKKKAEKTSKRVIKLNKTLEKALKKQYESDEKVVSKGSLDDVLAISDRLSQEQIDRAYKRISAKQKLEGLRPSADSKIDRLVNLGGKVATGAEHAYKIINNVNNFKGVMKDMKQAEIDEFDKAVEKERRSAVTKATRTGNVEEMKKVWGKATLEELRDMSDTLKLRYEIENIDYGKLDVSKAPMFEARKFSSNKKDDKKK